MFKYTKKPHTCQYCRFIYFEIPCAMCEKGHGAILYENDEVETKTCEDWKLSTQFGQKYFRQFVQNIWHITSDNYNYITYPHGNALCGEEIYDRNHHVRYMEDSMDCDDICPVCEKAYKEQEK